MRGTDFPLAAVSLEAPVRAISGREVSSRHRLLIASASLMLLCALGVLVWASSYLSAVRILQVDECQNMHMARVFSTGAGRSFFTTSSLFLFGPLSWITRADLSTEQMYSVARSMFFCLFWLNILLMARIAAGELLSLKGLVALVFAASLAPLWDYGFEIRHDNVLLTAVLLIWLLLRTGSAPLKSAIAGAISAAMFFVSIKSVIYTLPVSVLLLFVGNGVRIRLRSISLWIAGAAVAVFCIWMIYPAGAWNDYFTSMHGVANVANNHNSQSAGTFAPWFSLSRLLSETPLLLSLAVAAGVHFAAGACRNHRAALRANSYLPELGLVFIVLVALFINPSPFPYNLLHIVPYAFLLAFRYVENLSDTAWTMESLLPVACAVIFFAHVVPFVSSLPRHFDLPSHRQMLLTRLAEEMTEKENDPVYDATGLVLTRKSIGYDWYLHSLNMGRYLNGEVASLRVMLATNPAPVLIQNYRTDWLPEEDHEFIRQHYVDLAPDFSVLGSTLSAGSGEVIVYRSGRYRIAALKDSNIAGTYRNTIEDLLKPPTPEIVTGTVDSTTFGNAPVFLSAGRHEIKTSANSEIAVVWVGPKLNAVPRVAPEDRLKLFLNWY